MLEALGRHGVRGTVELWPDADDEVRVLRKRPAGVLLAVLQPEECDTADGGALPSRRGVLAAERVERREGVCGCRQGDEAEEC